MNLCTNTFHLGKPPSLPAPGGCSTSVMFNVCVQVLFKTLSKSFSLYENRPRSSSLHSAEGLLKKGFLCNSERKGRSHDCVSAPGSTLSSCSFHRAALREHVGRSYLTLAICNYSLIKKSVQFFLTIVIILCSVQG